MALHHNPRIVTSGLLYMYDPGDTNSYPGSGTTIFDLTNTANGTFAGSPNYSSDGRGSLNFNGPSTYDRIEITDTVTHKTGQSFTYEAWVYFDALDGYDKTIVGKPGCNIGLLQASSNMGMCVFGPNGVCASGNTQYYATVTATTGVWAHWVGTYQVGVGIATYKNGVLANSVAVTGNIGNWDNTLYIGGSISANYTMDGKVTAVKVYNRALTSAEISQNFETQKVRFGI